MRGVCSTPQRGGGVVRRAAALPGRSARRCTRSGGSIVARGFAALTVGNAGRHGRPGARCRGSIAIVVPALARHGMARPLWLCDIGVCLASLPADFDWDYCLWGRKHHTAWVIAVLGLADTLLGCRCEITPARPAHGWSGRCCGVGGWVPVGRCVTTYGTQWKLCVAFAIMASVGTTAQRRSRRPCNWG